MKLEENTKVKIQRPSFRIGKRNAYHQAGHIAAIHLGNSQKELPPVHFQLVAQASAQEEQGLTGCYARIPMKQTLKLEGGRLLPELPGCYEIATRRLSQPERQQCQCAIEADVINLLAASLAEAKYVANRDGEVFNANLVYLGALKFYGGSTDLIIIDEYMNCLFPDNKNDREHKLAELFLASYGFINDSANWKVITSLAQVLYNQPQEIFTCEELIALLDSYVQMTQENLTDTLKWPSLSRQISV